LNDEGWGRLENAVHIEVEIIRESVSKKVALIILVVSKSQTFPTPERIQVLIKEEPLLLTILLKCVILFSFSPRPKNSLKKQLGEFMVTGGIPNQ